MPRVKLQKCNSNGSDISDTESLNSNVDVDNNAVFRHRCHDYIIYFKQTDLPYISHIDHHGITRCTDCNKKLIISC